MINSALSKLFAIDDQYQLASWLFLKGLAIVYFIAFASLSVQIVGLVGETGIIPFADELKAISNSQGIQAYWKLPNIFWITQASDHSLQLASWLGCFFAILLLLGIAPQLSLISLFVLYLSLYHAGQLFLSFQWDTLLLESGFLAIFLHQNPSRLMIFLYHWLLFRLRFLSGLSKILTGDPSWSGLTSLNVYFETQPLPHIGAWYAHQLPQWLLQGATALVLFMELIVPFFIFLPRKFRLFAAITTIGLQLIIIATSNHNFINLLTIILCLFLLDDKFVSRILPSRIYNYLTRKNSETSYNQGAFSFKKIFTGAAAVLILSISLSQAYWYVFDKTLVSPFKDVARLGHQFGIGNVFHVFPTMQTERYEFQIEGSYDGQNWYAYEFKYKPGSLAKAPVFNVPHQPRLDWMIWFVPPKFPEMMQFFDKFMYRLWTNEKQVTELLEFNPFANQAAPKFLRVLVFRYRFTNPDERKESGNWWKAKFLGIYPDFPPRRP